MNLVTRYNMFTNRWETGYWLKTSFIILETKNV